MNNAVFTKEMRKEYTILMPMMAPIHFELIRNVFVNSAYNIELLDNTSQSVIECGLKYVHNDTCYPALLVIGQMIDALQSGKYDTHKVALIITQTGGGCRASNYIFLLKKALAKAGFDYVPVLSLNLNGMEKQPGFEITFSMLRKMLACLVYGDLLMNLKNQVKPYENTKGETEQLVSTWIKRLSEQFVHGKGTHRHQIRNNAKAIVKGFAAVPVTQKNLVKVGIVGEIYVKYSSLGNNCLEEILEEAECEINVPGMMGFMLYCVDTRIDDIKLYGGKKIVKAGLQLFENYLMSLDKVCADAISKYSNLRAPQSFLKTKEGITGIISSGNKMGEGWLLTAEMVELNETGFHNIICTQPFGCLPNHIAGKGMIRKIRSIHPDANIVAIDYDASATRVNQENRIKLMLSIAKEKMKNE